MLFRIHRIWCRHRMVYTTLLVATVLLGLLSRRYPDQTPAWVLLYAGDSLWAMMVYWLSRLAFPWHSYKKSGLVALLFSVSIELSQLFHTPWLDAVRATRLGGLVLGFGFLWSDLICYAVGVAVGMAVERSIFKSTES